MASSTETGHAKNIGNAFLLIQKLTGFGGGYTPSNPLLVVATMTTQHGAANTLQLAVNTQSGIFKPIVNARQDANKPVKSLTRRIVSAAKSCGATANFVKDVNTTAKKILGERASKATPTEGDPAGTSSSQQSFDNTANNFNLLVALLETEPLYVPGTADLKVPALKLKWKQLDDTNKAVKTGATPYNTAVKNRNKALYTVTTGLCDVCQAAKNEVRSAFGFSSSEFKQVSKIQFKKLVKIV